MGRKSNGNSGDLIELFNAGSHERAATAARKFTRRHPEDAIGWTILAQSLYRLGDLDGAEPAFRSAIRLAPQFADLHNELGLLLLDAGRPVDAEACLQAGLEQASEQADLLGNLGTALNSQQHYRDGEQAFRRALVLRPNDPGLTASLAYSLQSQLRYRAAAQQFRRAVSLQPGVARLRVALAGTLRELLEHEEAERCLRRAIGIAPSDAEAHANLGVVLTDQGRYDEALQAYRRACECDPEHVSARAGILRIKTLDSENPDGDPDLEALRSVLERDDLDTATRAKAHYAIGGTLARNRVDSDTEWYHISTGAELRRQQRPYDAEGQARHFERLQTVFTGATELADLDSEPDSYSVRPLFVVGMPRSGTTLVEQVLASHSAIETIGEGIEVQRVINATADTMHTTYPEGFDRLDHSQLARIGSEIRKTISEAHPGARWVIDKQPENHQHVGLLAQALPESVFVHTKRSAVDTCLSCFMRDFPARWATYTNDLADLAHYYRLYAGLMSHWRSTVRERLYEVEYENLVADFENIVRGLLSSLGLEWESGCADYYRAQRPVTTASRLQVRQPLYTSSIGAWRRYAHHLGPLFEALGPLASDENGQTSCTETLGSRHDALNRP